MRRTRYVLAGAFALTACQHSAAPTARVRPAGSGVAVGACASPGRDGVMGPSPRADRADRDLDGDGASEVISVDRALCSGEGNCYWNVFAPARAGECARYLGTLEGAALEPMPARGDDGMRDVRSYWNLHGGRVLLQSYRFLRGGYHVVEALLCKRAEDDKLDCADTEH